MLSTSHKRLFPDLDATSLGGDHLFDLDMLLTEEQYQQMQDPSSMAKRGAIYGSDELWPFGVIPYEITAGDFSQEEEEVIFSAMK